MTGMQKQKKGGDDEGQKQQQAEIKDDDKAKSVVERAKELLARPEPRKGGHYMNCCGIRTWVPWR